jgi:hypothetical protein
MEAIFILITNGNLNFELGYDRGNNGRQRQHDCNDMKICFVHTPYQSAPHMPTGKTLARGASTAMKIWGQKEDSNKTSGESAQVDNHGHHILTLAPEVGLGRKPRTSRHQNA